MHGVLGPLGAGLRHHGAGRGGFETNLPCRLTLWLSDRGLVRPGFAADLAIFDPATINTLEPEYVQDLPANETRMIQRAAGVHHTVVNGEVVIENGAATGAYPGKVLRPMRWKD